MMIPISTSHSHQSFVLLSALLFCSVLIQPCSANTQYSSENGSCVVLGDPDVYGLGVRLSFYLQWASLLVSTVILPEAATIASTTSYIVTLSVFINTFRSAVTKDSLMVVEWYIVSCMTLFLLVVLNPVPSSNIRKSVVEVLLSPLLDIIVSVTSFWLYFKGLHHGAKPGCSPQIFLVATHFSAYSRGWVYSMKVISILLLVGCILYWAVKGWKGVLDNASSANADSANASSANAGSANTSSANASSANAGSANTSSANASSDDEHLSSEVIPLGLCGVGSIVCAELTIRVNRVTFPGTSILDSGQLVPLLIGTFSMANVAGECLQKLRQRKLPVSHTSRAGNAQV